MGQSPGIVRMFAFNLNESGLGIIDKQHTEIWTMTRQAPIESICIQISQSEGNEEISFRVFGRKLTEFG